MTKPGFQNPHFRPHHDLGANSKSDAQWLALKDKVESYLKHVDRLKRSTVTTEELRALDPAFRNDRLWNQISHDLNLTPTMIPDG